MTIRHIRPSDFKNNPRVSEYLSVDGNMGILSEKDDELSGFALYRYEKDKSIIDHITINEDIDEALSYLNNKKIDVYVGEEQIETIGNTLKKLGFKSKLVKNHFGKEFHGVLFYNE